MQFRVSTEPVILHQFWGDDPGDFYLHLLFSVADVDAHAGDTFEVHVISPTALQRELDDSPASFVLGRRHLIAGEYDIRRVVDAIQRLVDGAAATSWNGLRDHISKYFDWT